MKLEQTKFNVRRIDHSIKTLKIELQQLEYKRHMIATAIQKCRSEAVKIVSFQEFKILKFAYYKYNHETICLDREVKVGEQALVAEQNKIPEIERSIEANRFKLLEMKDYEKK